MPGEPDIGKQDINPAEVGVSELVTMIMRDSLDVNLVQFGAAIPNPDPTIKRKKQILKS